MLLSVTAGGFLTFDWIDDDGYNKLGDWVEAAAKKAGR